MRKKGLSKNEKYLIEDSPFNKPSVRTKVSLKELQSTKDNIVLARKRHFRADEYTKVITNMEIDFSTYYKLSNLAKTVLYYIQCNCLEYNSPTFRFIVEEFLTMLKLSENSKPNVWKVINELIEANYIARTKTKEVYWINHNLYYKGAFIVNKSIKIKKQNDRH